MVAGCDANWWDPVTIDSYRNAAPVETTNDPGSPQFEAARYGSVVIGYDVLRPDRSVTIAGLGFPFLVASRFAVSGGASSSHYVWRGFEDRAVNDMLTTGLRPVFNRGDALIRGCRDRSDCGDGASTSLAAFYVYPELPGVGDAYQCIANPSGVVMGLGTNNERVNVRCESAPVIVPIAVPGGIDFGASGVGLPAIRREGCPPTPHEVGLALFGAPRANDQVGGVFVLEPGLVREIDLSPVGLPANASLGAQIAATTLDGATAVVLVSARSEERLASPMVLVMTLTRSGDVVEPRVHACLGGSAASPGFGRALAVGDLDGDERPELVVGGGDRFDVVAGEPEEPIQIWSYDALMDLHLAGCDGEPPPPAARVVNCDDVDDLVCADASITDRLATGFGAALAIGDQDADGIGDLVIGAPNARVRGTQSGGIVTLAGASTLAGLGVGAGNQAVIAPANSRTGMFLGYSVSTMLGAVGTARRYEIIAGAPGVGMASVFLCSGIEGDRPSDLMATAGTTYGCVLSASPGRPLACGPGMDAGVRDTGARLDAPDPLDAGVPDDAGDFDAFVDPRRDVP